MERIIRLDRQHIGQMAEVDHASEHSRSSKLYTLGEMEARLRERLEKRMERFFGLKWQGELVGYVTLIPSFPGHKHCELHWLAVKQQWQGRGIGSRLVRFMEDHARQHGFRKICLYTGKDMHLVRRFYEKNGYHKINEFPDFYGYPTGDRTAVLYAKPL